MLLWASSSAVPVPQSKCLCSPLLPYTLLNLSARADKDYSCGLHIVCSLVVLQQARWVTDLWWARGNRDVRWARLNSEQRWAMLNRLNSTLDGPDSTVTCDGPDGTATRTTPMSSSTRASHMLCTPFFSIPFTLSLRDSVAARTWDWPLLRFGGTCCPDSCLWFFETMINEPISDQ